MKVILKAEVDDLGLPGDVVEVADGYGRNYLLPRGLAILATRGAMKEAELLLRSRKAREARTVDAAQAARTALEARPLRIGARVDDRGGLYGSVTAIDVHRVLHERGHRIERKRIELKGGLKRIGTYEVPVRVHPQVTATVTVEIVDEEGAVTEASIAAAAAAAPAPLAPGGIVEAALTAAEQVETAEAAGTTGAAGSGGATAPAEAPAAEDTDATADSGTA